MKIALFTSSFFPEVNGVSVALWERIKCLKNTSHEVLLFCPNYQALSHIYPQWAHYSGRIFPNIQIINLPSKPFSGLQDHPTLAYASQSIIKNALDNFQPDIIHADDIERMYFGVFFRDFAVKYAKKNHIPCLAMYHTNFLQYLEDYVDTMPLLRLPFISSFLKSAILGSYAKYDLTLVSSKTISHYLQSLGARRVYCDDFLGIDVEMFNPGKRRPHLLSEKYGLPNLEDKIKVLSVGRLSADKGWTFLVSALTEISKKVSLEDVVLIIVGYGALEEKLKSQLSSLLNVHFLGKLSHSDVSEVYASSDIFLTASEKESKGLTVLEASASGIPVIAPRAGGIIESVKEGETGYLYEPGNKQDFFDKFFKLINDRELSQTMGMKGRYLAEKISWNTVFQNWISVLAKISNSR